MAPRHSAQRQPTESHSTASGVLVFVMLIVTLFSVVLLNVVKQTGIMLSVEIKCCYAENLSEYLECRITHDIFIL
jgi:hypothetical protein